MIHNRTAHLFFLFLLLVLTAVTTWCFAAATCHYVAGAVVATFSLGILMSFVGEYNVLYRDYVKACAAREEAAKTSTAATA